MNVTKTNINLNRTEKKFFIVKQPFTNTEAINSTPIDRAAKIKCNKIKTGHIEVKGRVNALRTFEQLDELKKYFLYHQNKRTQNKSYGIRNYCLVVFGINTMLRASDIINFKIKNVLNSDGSFKYGINVYEQKTGKKRTVIFNKSVQEAISLYLSTRPNYKMNEFLFPSNKSENGIQQPITTKSVWRILNQAGKDLNFNAIGLNLGSHSLRKTGARLGYEIEKKNGNQEAIFTISKALNHSSISVTERYLDITSDDVQNMFSTINL